MTSAFWAESLNYMERSQAPTCVAIFIILIVAVINIWKSFR